MAQPGHAGDQDRGTRPTPGGSPDPILGDDGMAGIFYVLKSGQEKVFEKFHRKRGFSQEAQRRLPSPRLSDWGQPCTFQFERPMGLSGAPV